ncbi:VOC family protein [Pontibacillus salicampi]|uniref:VOC family protein n=1 Tax=Pontibacillus salicampi TaxID=1449801 RepID=A0ABV6LT64_9BACI
MKHQATPYFTFNGNAREAMEFYKEVFEGEILDVQTFGEADFPTPPELENHIMHGRFQKEDLLIMFSDSFLDHTVTVGNNISLALELETPEEIDTLYTRLRENGETLMELQDTFWGATFAKVQDKYGVIWDLNYQK